MMPGRTGVDAASLAVKMRVPLGFAAAALFLLLARPRPLSVLVGFPVAAAGEALRIWAAGHITKGGRLTTSGPYGYVRNPLYLGSLLVLSGCVIGAWNVVLAAGLLGCFVLVYSTVMVREEKELLRVYREEYAEYKSKVPGVFPSFKAHAAGRGRHDWPRVITNREYCAALGLAAAFSYLLVRVRYPGGLF